MSAPTPTPAPISVTVYSVYHGGDHLGEGRSSGPHRTLAKARAAARALRRSGGVPLIRRERALKGEVRA